MDPRNETLTEEILEMNVKRSLPTSQKPDSNAPCCGFSQKYANAERLGKDEK